MAQDKLTVKQEGFSQDIASGKFDFDWLAYEANYSTKSMSKNVIYVESCRLLQSPKVAARVAELRKGIIKRNEVTIDTVLKQMADWLLFDPLSIIDEKTECVKSMKEMEKSARMSLSDIQVMEVWGKELGDDKKMHTVKIGELKKIKFIDKRSTADMFMKKFGAYVADNNDTASNLDKIREIIEAAKA